MGELESCCKKRVAALKMPWLLSAIFAAAGSVGCSRQCWFPEHSLICRGEDEVNVSLEVKLPVQAKRFFQLLLIMSFYNRFLCL